MTPVEKLQANIDKLPERDRGFAQSLVNQSLSRPLSPKQAQWVDTLLARTEQAQAVALVGADAVDGIIALIDRNNKAKYPAVRFLAGDKEMKVNRAGDRARFPGSLNVVVIDGKMAENEWVGRIHKDGKFEHSSRSTISKDLILTALRDMVKNPEEAAREYGRKTGHCCFCGLLLDDERSLLMGYGPVCAKNYGLAWGDRPAEVAS